MEHYLISIPVNGGYIHGYLMTDTDLVLDPAVERMIAEAEKQGFKCQPIILVTKLDDQWKLVRSVISRQAGGEPSHKWQTAKHFHLTAFAMPSSEPDTELLMELH